MNYAYIVLHDGWPETEETRVRIFEQCHQPTSLTGGKQDQLKGFEIPRKIIFIKELPRRSGTDKINYRTLEEMARG